MRQFIPILDWLPSYKSRDFSGDITAGLTVGVMLIPQGMAYSMLAGLPPIYGLYASTLPLIIYAIFGTSRQLAVGPVAMVALLISSGVGAIAVPGSSEFISLAILLALIVGLIQFLMGVMRLGFLVNFLSHPVVAGFTSAAAIIIGFSQLKHLLGLELPRVKVHETIRLVAERVYEINIPTLIIGFSAIVLLVLTKRFSNKIPGPLIVVLLGIGAVVSFGLHQSGVAIVRDVPGGLPSMSVPNWSVEQFKQLLPTALAIAFVGFMESIAVAKAIQAKHKNYKVIPNQELIGLGLANIIGSLFKAFPTTGGFSRTAVNDQAGAKTGLASIISAVLIIFTLLFLTDYFFYLPKAVLAAIIMVAVFGLIDISEAKHLWNTDRIDFALFMITGLGTLTLGVEEGIIIGVALSILIVIYHVSYPHAARLGRVPKTSEFRNVDRFEQLEEDEETLIVRFDAQLYFANLNSFKDFLSECERDKPKMKHLIIDAKPINNLDSSAVHMLHDLIEDYHKRGIDVYFVDVKGPVRDILERGKIFDLIGKECCFMTIQGALDAIKKGEEDDHRKTYALQTNNT